MNPEFLLTHFDRISDAPDAIPRLRRFILDLAVRGRLVEHDPSDEPASQLLNEIRAEKALRLKQDGAHSRRQSVTTATDHSQFVPPRGWILTTLGEVAHKITDGAHKTPTYLNQGVPFISVKDFSGGKLDFSHTRLISPEEHAMLYKRCDPRRGDILIGRIGTLGKAVLVDTDREFSLFVSVGLIRFSQVFIAPVFFRLLLNSPLMENEYNRIKVGGGTHTNKLNLGDLHTIIVPLPPLAEQHRIVAKVDELMALCGRLEAARNERESRRDRLGAASQHQLSNGASAGAFREHANFYIDQFPRMTTRPDQIKQLRQIILNLAVRGQLVSQDPGDEPAAQLLKRLLLDKAQLVKDGTIRKEKPLPPVDELTVPFNLPAAWKWTRLGNLSRLVTSGSRDWAKFYANDGAIFVRMGNLSRDSYHLRLGHIQRVKPPTDSEGARTRLEEGDVLISITGEVGLLGLIPHNFGESYINQHTCLVRPMESLKNRYLPELFRSPFAQHQFDEPQRGLKNSFRLTDVTHFLVPLPPLAEQRRIVAKVDELMALCDRLEAQLATAQEETSRLLESVLYSALSHIRAESTRQ
jgi:type I restriction enzyme S subunit